MLIEFTNTLLYRLIAIGLFRGKDNTTGHYLTLALHGESWYSFDDERVSLVIPKNAEDEIIWPLGYALEKNDLLMASDKPCYIVYISEKT